MLSFALRDYVGLSATRSERTQAPFYAEKHHFSDVTEVEPNTAAIGSAVFSHLVPDDIGFIGKPPGLEEMQTFREKRIWAPEVNMASVFGKLSDGKSFQFLQ